MISIVYFFSVLFSTSSLGTWLLQASPVCGPSWIYPWQPREDFKYYFADFVRKRGGGGTPQIRKSLFAEKKIRKGGEGGTPQIRNLFFGPKSGVF